MDKVCALVVTYFPGVGLISLIQQLAEEFEAVCVIDNGSDLNASSVLTGLDDSIFVILLGENLGVAAALNKGIEKASDLEYDYVCCFDQDSQYIVGSRILYKEALESNNASRIVGTNYKRPGVVSILDKIQWAPLGTYKPVKTVITSGSFFSIQLWQRIGGFDESLFIDSVDHDFCLKAYSCGGDVVLLSAFTIVHSVGEGESKIGVPIHAPIRKYYIFRNVVLTVRRYFLKHPCWSISQIGRLIVELISLVVFEPNKLAKLKLAIKGALHGMQGVTGRYDYD